MDMIREKIEASANVAIFLNKNRTITFEGETLQLIYVSGSELRGDEDFNKNIFAAVEEMNYSFHHDAKKIFAFRPDLSFFVNGIFLGYAELKSNFTNQTAKTNGRNKILPTTSKPCGNIPRLPMAMMYRKRFVVACSGRLRNRFIL